MQTAIATEVPALDFLWLELTNRCNLQCTHCYAESSPSSGERDILTEADYARTIDEGFELGCRQIQFIGGEPTLNRSLPKLIERASSAGYDLIEVFTNLVSMSEGLQSVVAAHGASIATSFYSCDPFTHDFITQSIGSFQKTTRNIQKLVTAGIPLRVSVIEVDANAGEYERTARFLRDIGVENISFDQVRGFGRAQPKTACDMGDLCGQCATNVLAIGPDGVVAPCIMSKQWAVGSLQTDTLAAIATSVKLRETRERISQAKKPLTTECQPVCGPNRQQCGPECGPSRQCSPCGPNAGHKCSPNSFCSPGR